MNFNFFDWIRDGVKRSVLLGVSDAVQTMGAPQDEESSKEKILSFLQDEDQATPARRRGAAASGSGSGQRKLGRSLNDIQPAKEAG